MAMMASACGGDEDGDADSSGGSASGSASASASEPADEASASEPSDGAEPETQADPEAETEESDPAVTVSVTDVVGSKDVPVTDENVYALDELMGTLLLTLGVEPIATGAFFEDVLLTPILEEQAGLVPFGSIEAVAAAKPDLILGIGHPNFIEIADDLDGVAPTVLPDFTATWQDQTRLIAQVVGREAEGDAAINAVQARTADLAAEVEAEGMSGELATIIQVFGPDYFAYGPTTVSGSILAELGFARSEAQSGSENFGFIPLAQELVPEETAVPYVFALTATAGDGTISTADDPLIDPEGREVAEVGEAWFNNTALGAWIVLDDLEAVLFDRGEITGIDGAAAAFEELLLAAVES